MQTGRAADTEDDADTVEAKGGGDTGSAASGETTVTPGCAAGTTGGAGTAADDTGTGDGALADGCAGATGTTGADSDVEEGAGAADGDGPNAAWGGVPD